jgi:hypothetical protein
VYIEKVELDATHSNMGLAVHLRQRLDHEGGDERVRAGITAVVETWAQSLAPRN